MADLQKNESQSGPSKEKLPKGFRLHFGIPSIDDLIGVVSPDVQRKNLHRRHKDSHARLWSLGLKLPPKDPGRETSGPAASSVNIIGGDGSGKSLLAMHMASAYSAELQLARKQAAVIYASSDYSYERANLAWNEFALNDPWFRRIPFEGDQASDDDANEMTLHKAALECGLLPEGFVSRNVTLQKFAPRDEKLYKYVYFDGKLAKDGDTEAQLVAFLDLAGSTSGDDWSFLSRLVSCLQAPAEDDWPHMLIVDAAEGFDTLGGDVDAYGQQATRRSRVAHLLQLAAGKCHIVIVNEVRDDRVRLDEEFVTDLVVRLGQRPIQDYSTRTIEMVKVRSQGIIRGDHPITIRGGNITETRPAKTPNPNNPPCKHAYIHCFGSVDARDRFLGVAEAVIEGVRLNFGVRYLDNMFQRGDDTGLPEGSLTGIIGGENTCKSEIARAFLACAYSKYKGRIYNPEPTEWQYSVYLTTGTMTQPEIAELLAEHLIASGTERARLISMLGDNQDHFLARNIQVTAFSPGAFAHALEEVVAEAKAHALYHAIDQTGAEIRKYKKIRLAIDDFGVMRQMQPFIEDDPLFASWMARFLKYEGITTVFVDTTKTGNRRRGPGEYHSRLHSFCNQTISTWAVPFFNENRVAISTQPSFSEDSQAITREAKTVWSEHGKGFERVIVDPHFELYSGVDRDDPQLVPLQVLLRGDDEMAARTLQDFNGLLGYDFQAPHGKDGIVSCLSVRDYEELRTLASRRSRHRTDQTTVIQIDEFWAHRESDGLFDMNGYLEEEIAGDEDASQLADPYRSFEPREDTAVILKRKESFDDMYGSLAAHPLCGEQKADLRKIDRSKCIPYSWDFGFLLLDQSAWQSVGVPVPDGTTDINRYKARHNSLYVERVYKSLTTPSVPDPDWRKKDDPSVRGWRLPEGPVGWRQFLRACQIVNRGSRNTDLHSSTRAFDVELNSPESFNCFFLEVWASEILISLNRRVVEAQDPPANHDSNCANAALEDALQLRKEFLDDLSLKGEESSTQPDLIDWLNRYEFEMYLAWLLVAEIFRDEDFCDPKDPLSFQTRNAEANAIASRHWYASSCDFARRSGSSDITIARCPGHFSTRGDWFLAVARNSRSRRLGEKAIDLLCSRRSSMSRLHSGVGLPVRKAHLSQNDRSGPGVGVRTALRVATSDGVQNIEYKKLVQFGHSVPPASSAPEGPSEGLYWLWRSNLVGYHRHARLVSQWMLGSLRWFGTVRNRHASDWRSGFKVYDRLRLFEHSFRFQYLAPQDETKDGSPLKDAPTQIAQRIKESQGEFDDLELHDAKSPLLIDLFQQEQDEESEKDRIKRFARDDVSSLDKSFRRVKTLNPELLVTAWGKISVTYGSLDSFLEFRKRCQFLKEGLQAATTAPVPQPKPEKVRMTRKQREEKWNALNDRLKDSLNELYDIAAPPQHNETR